MSMNLSDGIAILSAIFGAYQWWQAKKLKTLTRQDTWSSYRDAATIFGGLQKLREKNQSDTELANLAGQAEQMMNDKIRQINVYEKITLKKIDEWNKAKRLCHPTHMDVFNKFADK